MDMSQQKINIEEIKNWSSKKIASYIGAITQTPICSDKKYCNDLIKIYLSKPILNAVRNKKSIGRKAA
jgi:hypothetical protein